MITNDIISECSKYPTCRDLWEKNCDKIPFSCKDCVGYECYWRGYNDGVKELQDENSN